jgi:hypothetical protein
MGDVYRGMYPFIAIQIVGLNPVHRIPQHRAVAAAGDRVAGLSPHPEELTSAVS